MSAVPGSPTTAESALLRRTRLRLMLWSGGLTLVVLLILGGAVYLTVSRALAAGGRRCCGIAPATSPRFVSGPGPGPGRPAFADRRLLRRSRLRHPRAGRQAGRHRARCRSRDGLAGHPRRGRASTRRANGRRRCPHGQVDEIPVRILSQAVERDDGTYVVQIVGERLSEQRLLDALTTALVVGGLTALLLACRCRLCLRRPRAGPHPGRDGTARRCAPSAARVHGQRQPRAANAADASSAASVDDLRRNQAERVADVGDALDDIEVEVAM